jgi:hypothetical protein
VGLLRHRYRQRPRGNPGTLTYGYLDSDQGYRPAHGQDLAGLGTAELAPQPPRCPAAVPGKARRHPRSTPRATFHRNPQSLRLTVVPSKPSHWSPNESVAAPRKCRSTVIGLVVNMIVRSPVTRKTSAAGHLICVLLKRISAVGVADLAATRACRSWPTLRWMPSFRRCYSPGLRPVFQTRGGANVPSVQGASAQTDTEGRI